MQEIIFFSKCLHIEDFFQSDHLWNKQIHVKCCDNGVLVQVSYDEI